MNNVAPGCVVLLVEDEKADAELVQWALNKNKIQADIRHATDGYEAFNYLKRNGEKHEKSPRPNLILLDLNMPKMGGLELLAEIKKSHELVDIPVVILTTSHSAVDIESAYKLGAADFFSKPMDIHELVEMMRTLGDRWITPCCSKDSERSE